ncbi:hypothetical protein JFL75_06415 [Breznakiella homolactica]|nr:hypothetical protein JFL75_06415 [Breznakiella homolactica]
MSANRLPFMPLNSAYARRCIGVDLEEYISDYRVLVKGQLAFAEKFHSDYVSVVSKPSIEAEDYRELYPLLPEESLNETGEFALFNRKEGIYTAMEGDYYQGRLMTERLKAITEFRRTVGGSLLVEGWVEGAALGASITWGTSRLLMDFYDDPAFVKQLLEYVAGNQIEFLRRQIEAGAESIGVGEPVSSLLGPDLFTEFLVPLHMRYVSAIHDAGALARLHICGNIMPLFPVLEDIPYDIIDLDSPSQIGAARSVLGPDRVLLGNIDPVSMVRDGTPASISAALETCFEEAGGHRYIVGAGCEIPYDTPEENILAMSEFAGSHKPYFAGLFVAGEM